MLHHDINRELTKILQTTRKIEYKGIMLYLIDKTVRDDNEENGIKKRNHF